MRHAWLIALTLVACGNAGATADPWPHLEAIRGIEDELVREMRTRRIAGAVLVVVAGDEVVHARGYGYANAKSGELIRPSTPMRGGEFSKLAIAMAIMSLVDQQRLDLEVPITTYLPDVEFFGRAVDLPAPTIRQLLSHHGGLVNNLLAGSLVKSPQSIGQVPSRFERSTPPDTIYIYSHLAYTLLGEVVAAIAGEPFADYVSAAILAPLGMTHTTFTPSSDRARPHDRARRVVDERFARDQAALGLYTSGEDLGRLMRWWLADSDEPLSRASRKAMVSRQNRHVALDLENRAGLAWQLTNTGGYRTGAVWRLESVLPHHRAAMVLAPDERLGVVVISNSSAAGDFVVDFSQLILHRMIESVSGRSYRDYEDRLKGRIELPDGAADDPMSKRYSTGFGLAELEMEGSDRYVMSFLGRTFGLRRRDDGWYRISYRLFGFIDVRISVLREVLVRPARIGAVQGLLAYYGTGAFLFGTRLADHRNTVDPTPFTGHYELTEADPFATDLGIETIELVCRGGLLRAVYTLPYDVEIHPQAPLVANSDGQWLIPGLGTNMGGSVTLGRTAAGGAEVSYSGWTWRRVNTGDKITSCGEDS